MIALIWTDVVDTLVKYVFLVVFPQVKYSSLTKRFSMVLVSHDKEFETFDAFLIYSMIQYLCNKNTLVNRAYLNVLGELIIDHSAESNYEFRF